MRFIVYYRRKTGSKVIRNSEHKKPLAVSEKEFRLELIREYNERNRKVISIDRIEDPKK